MSNFREPRAEGFLEIQDGFYEIKKNVDDSVRRGIVRQEQDILPPVEPTFLPDSNKKSFQIDVSCLKYISVVDESGNSVETKSIIRNDYTYRKLAGKNYHKDIKNFICNLAGNRQASLVRKRLIGLEKIHKTISNEKFRFPI